MKRREFEVLDDNKLRAGPWAEANQFCQELETGINRIISRAEKFFPLSPIDFANDTTLTLNDDIEKLYHQLEMVDEDNGLMAHQIWEECERFIEKVGTPRLLTLEVIILLNAFNIKGKPIIDLFYTYDDLEQRKLRDPNEFCYIMGGGFMALFYKVSGLLL